MTSLTALWAPLAAFVCALAAVRPAEALGRRLGLVDRPGGALKIHAEPTPRSGGVAIFAALCVAALVGYALDRPLLDLREAAVGCALFGLGLWDDRSPRSARLRMLLQIAIYAGGYALGLRAHPAWPAWGVFVSGMIWLVVVVNAANFYDGMDGVLPLTALAALVIWGIGARGLGIESAITLAAAGAVLGFLPRNWYPSRIFLGDGGSFLIGYVFYLTLVRASNGGFGPVPGLLIAVVPVCDAGGATLYRIFHRKGVLTGDRDHIYDILARRGLSSPAVAILLGALSGLCALLAVFSAPMLVARWAAAIALYVVCTAVVLLMRKRHRIGA